MSEDIYENLKGFIEFPCGCKSKVLVYKGTTGKASIQCPCCMDYGLFDYNAMTATCSKTIKGAVNRIKNSRYH